MRLPVAVLALVLACSGTAGWSEQAKKDQPKPPPGQSASAIGWTYKQFEGYAPIAAYLGEEGWALGFELREGTQHSQKETPAFLARVSAQAKKLVNGRKILLRMDSGNDAMENYAIMRCNA